MEETAEKNGSNGNSPATALVPHVPPTETKVETINPTPAEALRQTNDANEALLAQERRSVMLEAQRTRLDALREAATIGARGVRATRSPEEIKAIGDRVIVSVMSGRTKL